MSSPTSEQVERADQTCPECSGTREVPFGIDPNGDKCANSFHAQALATDVKVEELTDEQKVAMQRFAERLYNGLTSVWLVLDYEKHPLFGDVDSILKRVEDVLNGTYKAYRHQLEINRKGEQRRIYEAELDELGRLIPNFDGVGTIGYQYDDESRVALEVRMNQLDDQVEALQK